MTKFITYYNLCPIHDTKEFMGISLDKDDGNVITTLAKNLIAVIKVRGIFQKLNSSNKIIFYYRSVVKNWCTVGRFWRNSPARWSMIDAVKNMSESLVIRPFAVGIPRPRM